MAVRIPVAEMAGKMRSDQAAALKELGSAGVAMVSTHEADPAIKQGKDHHANSIWRHLNSIGADFKKINCPTTATAEKHLGRLADNDLYTGVVLQLPVSPDSKERLVKLIPPHKDVDGLTSASPNISTAAEAAFRIAHSHFGTSLADQRVAIIGSGYVGRPLIERFHDADIDPRVVDLRNPEDLEKVVSWGSLVCAAVGEPNLIAPGMISEGSTLIDIGGSFHPAVREMDVTLAGRGAVGLVNAAVLGYNFVQATRDMRTLTVN